MFTKLVVERSFESGVGSCGRTTVNLAAKSAPTGRSSSSMESASKAPGRRSNDLARQWRRTPGHIPVRKVPPPDPRLAAGYWGLWDLADAAVLPVGRHHAPHTRRPSPRSRPAATPRSMGTQPTASHRSVSSQPALGQPQRPGHEVIGRVREIAGAPRTSEGGGSGGGEQARGQCGLCQRLGLDADAAERNGSIQRKATNDDAILWRESARISRNGHLPTGCCRDRRQSGHRG